MKIRDFILSAFAVFVMASSPLLADVVLITNDFDGDNADGDLGGAFVIVSNGLEDNDMTDPANGLLSFEDTGASNPAVGFTSSTAVDASTKDGFTMEWVVEAGFNTVDVASNGWFFGVQDAVGVQGDGTTLWNNNPEALGVTLFRNGGGSNAEFVDSVGGNNFTSLGSSSFAEALSGFTLSLTVNSDGTWSVSSVGLDAGSGELTGSGSLQAGDYGIIADTLFASTTFQIRNNSGVQSGGQYSSVNLTALCTEVIPEPSSLAVLGLVGLAGFVRRRR